MDKYGNEMDAIHCLLSIQVLNILGVGSISKGVYSTAGV